MVQARATALITGASAGLGVDFARQFAKDGHDLVLVARRRDKLDALASELTKAHGIQCSVVAADLTERGAPQRIFDELETKQLVIDFLVNNAGFGTTGPFAGSDLQRELELVEVNVVALMGLTRLFLPGMIARKRGRIMNVASTAGFLPGPFMASYYASKAFVVSFTEALAFELRGSGVTVTACCPGATATEFALVAGNDKSALFRGGVATSAAVATHGYHAMLAGQVIAIPGFMNKLKMQFLRVSPRTLMRSVAAKLNQA